MHMININFINKQRHVNINISLNHKQQRHNNTILPNDVRERREAMALHVPNHVFQCEINMIIVRKYRCFYSKTVLNLIQYFIYRYYLKSLFILFTHKYPC